MRVNFGYIFCASLVVLTACSIGPKIKTGPATSIDGFNVSTIVFSNGTKAFIPQASPGSSCSKIETEAARIKNIMKNDIQKFRKKGNGEEQLASFYLHLLSALQTCQ